MIKWWVIVLCAVGFLTVCYWVWLASLPDKHTRNSPNHWYPDSRD